MTDKRNTVQKEVAYGYFIKAFDIAGIAYTTDFNGEGQELIKPERAWYRTLVSKMAEIFPQVEEIHNYPNYLKDRFNSIKSMLYAMDQSEFNYSTEHFDPLIHYATQQLASAPSRTFSEMVFYRSKKYSRFNLWRQPEVGKLIRFENQIRFEGDQTLTFPPPKEFQLITMPPFFGIWVQVTTTKNDFYFAISDGEGKILKNPEALTKFIS